MNYVLGFALTDDLQWVALMPKARPSFQKGFWNGIGGEINAQEPPPSAMRRESYEESGFVHIDWTEYGSWTFADGKVYLFKAIIPRQTPKTSVEEQVSWVRVEDALAGAVPMLPNTRWFLAAALDPNIGYIQSVNKSTSWKVTA